MIASTPFGLSQQELDELQAFLGQHPGEAALGVDGVHGLLAAIVVGPEPVPANEWLGRVFDEIEGFADAQSANRALSLIVRLHQSVVQELEALSFEPIFGEFEDEAEGAASLAAIGWCEGFSLGIDLRGEVWEARMASDPQLLDLLDPIIRIAADEGLFTSESGESLPDLELDEREELLSAIAPAVADIQQYWRDHPLQAGEVESAAPRSITPIRRRAGQWLH